jgi:hypothetical protein
LRLCWHQIGGNVFKNREAELKHSKCPVAASVGSKEADAPFATAQLRSVECAVAVLKLDDAKCFVVVDFPLVSGPAPRHRAAVGNTEAPMSGANPVFE